MTAFAPKFLVLLLFGVSCLPSFDPAAAQTAATQSNFALIKDAAESIAAGDLQKAETELKTVLAANPSEFRAMSLLGVVRAQQHREAEAEQLFKQRFSRNRISPVPTWILAFSMCKSTARVTLYPNFKKHFALIPAAAMLFESTERLACAGQRCAAKRRFGEGPGGVDPGAQKWPRRMQTVRLNLVWWPCACLCFPTPSRPSRKF